MECYFNTWAAFSLSKFLTVVNIDHFLHPSPQDPPLKLTINIVSSISTTQASLWSQSMMDSALTWWVTLPWTALPLQIDPVSSQSETAEIEKEILLYLFQLSATVFLQVQRDCESHLPSVSFDGRDRHHLLAQTAAIQMTTTCPWILAPHHSALARLTVLRISTFLWAQGHITLISQDSLQLYLPVRRAVPPCATGPVVSVMLHHRLSIATSNLTENVRFWHLASHFSLRACFKSALKSVVNCWRPWYLLITSALVFLQQSQHLLIWRTMGSLMSCHLRVRSLCPGHDPCESYISAFHTHTVKNHYIAGSTDVTDFFPPYVSLGLLWTAHPPSTVDPSLHKASPAPTLQTVKRIMWLW